MAEATGLIPFREKIAELERAYFKIQREIATALLSVDPASYKETGAISAQNKTEVLIRRLNRMAIRWAKESVPIAYRRSYIVSKTKLEVLGMEKDADYDLLKHRRTVEFYIEKTMKDLVDANQSIKNNVNMYLYLAKKASEGLAQIQQFDPMDEGVLAEIVTDTIEQGKARGYASKRIHEYLRLKLLDGNFIDKAGRSYNLRAYSKMVARTRLRMAQTAAVRNTCAQFDNDLVQISQHASPCDECSTYEGQIYSISGEHPQYSMLVEEPPFHPNCEHDMSPTSEVAIQYREQYA